MLFSMETRANLSALRLASEGDVASARPIGAVFPRRDAGGMVGGVGGGRRCTLLHYRRLTHADN